MLKIGSLILEVPFLQAPLSGYSDYAMRRLGLDFGVPLTFSGVMLAKSAAHRKVLAKPAFRPHEDEHPVGAQILGDDPATMAKAAKALEGAGYDIIDLNFACPAPKVVRRQRGGYLLKEPEAVMEIYSRVREAVTCPVTMKLRTGFDSSTESYDNFHQIVAEASRQKVDALIIHGRSVVRKFAGEVDWDLIAEIKHRFESTTIIGSGDLFEAKTTIQRLKDAKIDGVLIARGAIGNPWIYQDLNALWSGKPATDPRSLAEQAQVMRKHFEMICRLYEPIKAVRYFRKFLVRYCKFHPQRKHAQKALLAADNGEDLLIEIGRWYEDHRYSMLDS